MANSGRPASIHARRLLDLAKRQADDIAFDTSPPSVAVAASSSSASPASAAETAATTSDSAGDGNPSSGGSVQLPVVIVASICEFIPAARPSHNSCA